MALKNISGFISTPDDLSQLKLIDAQAVRDLAKEVNSLKKNDLKGRKLVILLATGGTVAMATKKGIRRPALQWKDLCQIAGTRVQQDFEIRGINAFCIDSSQMNYAHTRELAISMCYLWKNIKVPFIGFLITHGTDTMSYSAAAMSLMTGQGLPFSIVYTGSQRPPDDPMSDAQTNLRNALYTLEALHSKDMAEVLIVMGERAMLATSSEKIDDKAANAFAAPRHCYVTKFNHMEYPVKLASWLRPRRRQPFVPTIWKGDWSRTLVINSTLGLNPEMVEQQINTPLIKAVIVYSYGAGTVDEKVLAIVAKTAQKRRLPVFIVSPVHADFHAVYESSDKALKTGIVPINLTLSAALAKIEIALQLYPDNLKALSKFVATNYVGEVPTEASGFNAGI